MGSEIFHEAIVMAFGILQALLVGGVIRGFKTYCDVKRHSRDLKAAFQMIREIKQDLEERHHDDR